MITRRDTLTLLPALAPFLAGIPLQAKAETSLPSAVYEFDKLPVAEQNHFQIRHVLKGKLATGEAVEVHESTLPPNGMPHPPHHHLHSELWLVREGMVQLTINGAVQVIGPGGVGFVRSNEEHGIKNVGNGPANYFVVAFGRGADTQT